MPIHDLSYRRWDGTRIERSPVLVLALAHVRLLLGRRFVRLLLLASGIFTLVWGTMVYLESHAPDSGPFAEAARVIRVDARSLHQFLVRQRLIHLLLCVVAADLIALDRRHRALQIYLARPLTPRGYVVAKGAAVALLLSLASWVPGLVLLLFKVAVRAEITWLAGEPWLPLSILGYSLLLVVASTLLTLAVSSLSSSPRFAGALLFGAVALSATTAQVLSLVTRQDAWQLLSLNANLDQVAASLFDVPPPHEMATWHAVAALVALAVLAALVLHRRIRPVDIVGGA